MVKFIFRAKRYGIGIAHKEGIFFMIKNMRVVLQWMLTELIIH